MAVETIAIFEVGNFEAQIARGVAALEAGNLIVLPTETVYGVAGMLTHTEARSRLQKLRNGDTGKPLTIHLARREDALKFLGPVSDLGRRMMKKLWPGPVGLVFEVPEARRLEVAQSFGLDESALYNHSNIVLRCPDDIVATEILGRIDAPVALTQAPGSSPATKVDSLPAALAEQVELIFDTGPSRYAKPSTIVKVEGETYRIVREGVYDDRIIQRLLRTTILFICSGNTCRSPMAEALARKILSKRLSVSSTDLDRKGVSVISAGSFALPGAQATPQAVEAVKDLGGDLSRHRSRPLSVELIHQADVIYVMGRSHTQAVAALVPSAMEKTKMLSPDGDIEDPIGSSVDVYRKLAQELEVLIETRLKENADLT